MPKPVNVTKVYPILFIDNEYYIIDNDAKSVNGDWCIANYTNGKQFAYQCKGVIEQVEVAVAMGISVSYAPKVIASSKLLDGVPQLNRRLFDFHNVVLKSKGKKNFTIQEIWNVYNNKCTGDGAFELIEFLEEMTEVTLEYPKTVELEMGERYENCPDQQQWQEMNSQEQAKYKVIFPLVVEGQVQFFDVKY